MTKMGIAKAAVAGHSLGGEFSLDFPEQTAGLILIASGGYPSEEMPGADTYYERYGSGPDSTSAR
jgi:pimeloyl-ACP methyl ester carboxylesterase